MANIGSGVISKVRLSEQGSSPAAPAATYWLFYVKAGGLFYKDSANNEYQVGKAADAASIQGKAVDTTAPTNGQVLVYSTGSGKYIPTTPNAGTVTSVALTVPTGFGVGGSPVTGAGTLALSLSAQSGNKLLASPADGTSGTPAFRAVAPADLPAFVASGGSHAGGAVPDPGASAGATRFLREDATFAVPPSGSTPATALDELEDFVSGTTSSGGIGKLGWAATNGARQYVVPNDAGPGVLFFGTDSVANTPASIQMATPYVLLGGALFDVTIYTRPASADSTVTLRCGLMGDPTSDPPGGQGAYFEKLPADANWFGVTRQSGSQARTASLATNPNDGAFHRLRVRRIDAGNVGFGVDGGTEVVATTHLPVDELTVGYQIIATDTNTHNVNLDYVWLRVTGLAR